MSKIYRINTLHFISFLFFCQKLEHRLDKSHKEWMWVGRTGGEFWMRLRRDHIWMISKFDDLCEGPIWRSGRDDESLFLHLSSIRWIELKTMSVSF